MSYIYIIGSDNNAQVKIGFTKKPKKRLMELQTGNQNNLKIYHTFEVDDSIVKHVEKLIHNQLVNFREKGEWFNLSPEEAKLEVEFVLIFNRDKINGL